MSPLGQTSQGHWRHYVFAFKCHVRRGGPWLLLLIFSRSMEGNFAGSKPLIPFKRRRRALKNMGRLHREYSSFIIKRPNKGLWLQAVAKRSKVREVNRLTILNPLEGSLRIEARRKNREVHSDSRR